MKKIDRQIMPVLPFSRRVESFDEVELGFTLEQAHLEALRCLNCKNAPCKTGCPTGNRIPEFIQAFLRAEYLEAFKIIQSVHDMPSVCGRVCHKERQCEGACIRSRIDKPVAIGALERFVGDYFYKNFLADYTTIRSEKLRGKRVAVFGGGAASLAFSAHMLREGADVTIYEKADALGGLLTFAIPSYRLPNWVAKHTVDYVVGLGARVEFNVELGKDIGILKAQSDFDAVFIGVGMGEPRGMDVPNEEKFAISSREFFSLGERLDSKRVAVFGGGNVAVDAARTAIRRGASDVTIIYRRTLADMPASREEVEAAKFEGVKFIELSAPVEFSEGAAHCVKFEQSKARGKLSRILGSEFDFLSDIFVVAVGNRAIELGESLEVDERGAIVVNSNYMTNLERVYAGGDCVRGASTVVSALFEGKSAAVEVVKKLGEK